MKFDINKRIKIKSLSNSGNKCNTYVSYFDNALIIYKYMLIPNGGEIYI